MVALVAAMCVLGCGDSTDDGAAAADVTTAEDTAAAPDPGGEGDVSPPPADEGTPPADEGTPPADEGTPPADEGAPPTDEGPPPTDEGAPPADEGTPPADEGTPPADEGTPPTDEGTPPTDEGAPPEDTSAGCTLHSQCEQPDLCTKALCMDGECVTAPASCEDDDGCTSAVCELESGCALAIEGEGCAAWTDAFVAHFDDGTLDSMTVVELTGAEGATATWVPDPSETWVGAGALYFGIPGQYDYATGARVAAQARTPAVALPAGKEAQLTFAVWHDVEDGSDWDVLSVSLVAEGGAAVPVWHKDYGAPPAKQWSPTTVDISAWAGTTVEAVFTFDSMDGTYNDGLGVLLDVVRLRSAPTPKTCSADADCDDGLSCTLETCESGTCSYAIDSSCCATAADCSDNDLCTLDICNNDSTCENVPVANPACCNSAADCDDSNDCTEDICLSGQNTCTHKISDAPGCCFKDSECDDSDACTIDSCVDNVCGHVNDCCSSDAECDDGDDVCTQDTCVNGDCVFALKPVPGCCTPVLFEDAFDAGIGDGWQLTGGAGGCKWQVTTSGKTKSKPGSLYYGDNSTKDIDCGASNGTALTTTIALPDKAGPKLEFDLYLSADTFLDTFVVSVIDGSGKQNAVYTMSPNTTTNIWSHKIVSLTAYKGQTIQIQFSFSSIGLPPFGFETFEGVYVDNVAIKDSCQ